MIPANHLEAPRTGLRTSEFLSPFCFKMLNLRRLSLKVSCFRKAVEQANRQHHEGQAGEDRPLVANVAFRPGEQSQHDPGNSHECS